MGKTKNTRDVIKEQQARWAFQKNIKCPRKGYTICLPDNILMPTLSVRTVEEYLRGRGKELSGKMLALHSSSVLVINIFEYWRQSNRISDIALACGAQNGYTKLSFEKLHHIPQIGRIPPHLDVEISGGHGKPLAIESKFIEPYSRTMKRPNRITHLDKYLKKPQIWKKLPKCKLVAESIVSEEQTDSSYHYLDVPQLLKHILGLNSSYPEGFTLLYLWYDIPSAESEQHRSEMAILSSSIASEVDLRTMTYQELYRNMCDLPNVDEFYLRVISQRYFHI